MKVEVIALCQNVKRQAINVGRETFSHIYSLTFYDRNDLRALYLFDIECTLYLLKVFKIYVFVKGKFSSVNKHYLGKNRLLGRIYFITG